MLSFNLLCSHQVHIALIVTFFSLANLHHLQGLYLLRGWAATKWGPLVSDLWKVSLTTVCFQRMGQAVRTHITLCHHVGYGSQNEGFTWAARDQSSPILIPTPMYILITVLVLYRSCSTSLASTHILYSSCCNYPACNATHLFIFNIQFICPSNIMAALNSFSEWSVKLNQHCEFCFR